MEMQRVIDHVLADPATFPDSDLQVADVFSSAGKFTEALDKP